MVTWIRRHLLIPVLLVALVAVGFVATSAVIGDNDPRRSGEVTKIDEHPDGSVSIYRSQADGELIIEHQEATGEVWFESNEVVGQDGELIICPNGEPLRIDLGHEAPPPTPEAARDAQQTMPEGKRAVFNEYTGEFEAVDAVTKAGTYGEVTVSEPLVYKCDANNEPMLVPLSEVDPEAARDAHRAMAETLEQSDELTGLGGDPAAEARSEGR